MRARRQANATTAVLLQRVTEYFELDGPERVGRQTRKFVKALEEDFVEEDFTRAFLDGSIIVAPGRTAYADFDVDAWDPQDSVSYEVEYPQTVIMVYNFALPRRKLIDALKLFLLKHAHIAGPQVKHDVMRFVSDKRVLDALSITFGKALKAQLENYSEWLNEDMLESDSLDGTTKFDGQDLDPLNSGIYISKYNVKLHRKVSGGGLTYTADVKCDMGIDVREIDTAQLDNPDDDYEDEDPVEREWRREEDDRMYANPDYVKGSPTRGATMITPLRDLTIRLAHNNPTLRSALLPLVTRVAKEHATEDARAKYLKEHPKADPRNHTVKAPSKDKKPEDKKPEDKKPEDKKPEPDVYMPADDVKAITTKPDKASFESNNVYHTVVGLLEEVKRGDMDDAGSLFAKALERAQEQSTSSSPAYRAAGRQTDKAIRKIINKIKTETGLKWNGRDFTASRHAKGKKAMPVRTPHGKLKLGRLVATRGVNADMQRQPEFAKFVQESLDKYVRGDWGDTKGQDARMNDQALKNGDDRILAVYELPRHLAREVGEKKIWIITEWDRSASTILYPSEY